MQIVSVPTTLAINTAIQQTKKSMTCPIFRTGTH
jgi:hypothetical protein